MKIQWKTFSLKGAKFNSEKNKAEYIENCRCAVCHQKLQEGDKYDLRAITNNSGWNQQAVIVHKKCVKDLT